MTAKKTKADPAELQLAEDQPATAIQNIAITPMHMLAIAVEKGHDLDRIEKLMDLERIWKEDLAREAYYRAMTEFKKTPVTVTKDKSNAQYQSKYTSIGNLVNTVNAAMAPFGLSASWRYSQSNGIQVTCILAHSLGHTESATLYGPPDESGKKNSLQQIKSTNTYLRKETFEAVTGIVTSDDADDDGNSAVATITKDQVKEIEKLIKKVGADRAGL